MTSPTGARFSIAGPRALEFSRDGRALLVASEAGVVALRRDPADGRLGCAQSEGLDAAHDVAIPLDGRSTYATAYSDDRVEVYVPEPGAVALSVAAALAMAGLRRSRGAWTRPG